MLIFISSLAFVLCSIVHRESSIIVVILVVKSGNTYLTTQYEYKHCEELREISEIINFNTRNNAETTNTNSWALSWHIGQFAGALNSLCTICWLQNDNFCNFPLFWADYAPGPSGQIYITFSTKSVVGFVGRFYWKAKNYLHMALMFQPGANFRCNFRLSIFWVLSWTNFTQYTQMKLICHDRTNV